MFFKSIEILGSLKHVIKIILQISYMGCYIGIELMVTKSLWNNPKVLLMLCFILGVD
jgi:hypothetical protein